MIIILRSVFWPRRLRADRLRAIRNGSCQPFQKAAEGRFGKGLAVTFTITLTLVVLSLLVGAIVWSVSDIIHWGFANLERFQSLYARTTQWLHEHDLFVVDLESLGSFSFRGCSKPLRDMSTTLLGLRLSSFYSWRLVWPKWTSSN